jgi:plasmid stability protein
MASLTVRNLDPTVKERLRIRAAHHGRSMEEEVRSILQDAAGPIRTDQDLASIALSLFGPDHGVELELPPREMEREPPSFA